MITCEGCGACCSSWLRVEVDPDELVPPDFTDDECGQLVMAMTVDGCCTALDRRSKVCRIYEDRPQPCRDFEVGGERCRRLRIERA